MTADSPIGIMDSGMGGISVLREITALLPNENFIFYGDSKNAPYGSRTTEEIYHLTSRVVDELLDRGVKAVVIACNTASAYALPEIEKECPVPVIGVIRPGARTATACTRNGRIGVIGTRATISSGTYKEYIRQIMYCFDHTDYTKKTERMRILFPKRKKTERIQKTGMILTETSLTNGPGS